MNISDSRQKAIAAGLKTYHGKPCKACGSTEKLTRNYECVACSHAKRNTRNRRYWERLKQDGQTVNHSRKYRQARIDYYNKNKASLKQQLHEKKKDLGEFYVRKLLTNIRSKCKRSGIPFDLTPDDIDIPSHCPVLGIKLQANQGLGNNDDSPSIDRIRPNEGYIRDNIVVVSKRANKIKNDASSEELKRVYMFYKDRC